MNGHDVEAASRRVVPRGTQVFHQVTGCQNCPTAMVDIHEVLCCRWDFAPVQRGVNLRDGRPRTRVSGCFASEVSGIEFLEGCVDFVEVEGHGRDDPLVGVDLHDDEHVCEKSFGPLIAERQNRHASRARRCPRVASTVDVRYVVRRSAIVRMSAIWASRPCRTPAPTTRRRSSW